MAICGRPAKALAGRPRRIHVLLLSLEDRSGRDPLVLHSALDRPRDQPGSDVHVPDAHRQAGAERPVARIDDETYVDLSDVVDDFDEAFFGGGGWTASARS